MSDVEGTLRVFADNPTELDLLGFRPVATAVAEILAHNAEMVTVGLHGPWGSGKSSLLTMVQSELTALPKVHAVMINPWEFDDHTDVKGTLIGAVLESLQTLTADPTLTGRIGGMLKRISWARATTAIAKGALTMQWDVDQLITAFTPVPEDDSQPRTMAGFRSDFADLIDDLDVERVVVLLDDLDRCLPGAVMATLESIKLFLSVPKMAFVLAADQDMVREAIAAGLGEQHRSQVFARDYLDKIVQVPVALPYPTTADAEAYVGLLLAQQNGFDADQLDVLIAHAVGRRTAGEVPYLDPTFAGMVDAQHLLTAERCVRGLGGEDVLNPRRVKRFLNALSVRRYAMVQSGVTLKPDVFVKLFLLEHRFVDLFRTLASMTPTERSEMLTAAESWDGSLEPDASVVPPDARALLKAEPSLAGEDIDPYLTIARRLSKTRVTAGVSPEVASVVVELLDDRTGSLERGLEHAKALDSPQQEQLVDEIAGAARRSQDPEIGLTALLELAGVMPHMGERVATVVRLRKEALRPGHALQLRDTSVPELVALAGDLRTDSSVPEMARNTLAQASTAS